MELPETIILLFACIQLIKDMVSVSEVTSWSARPGTQAKYRALGCNIFHVEPGTQEHKHVSEEIHSSVDRFICVMKVEWLS